MSLIDVTEDHASQISDGGAEQLLIDLVNIASPSTQESQAAAYLVAWMNVHGYDDAFIDEAGNAVGIIGHGERTIVLLGHIDTFGGNFPVRLEGRDLYGRGSVDAKGSLCAFAVAAAQATLPPNTRLVVIGAVEEEAPSSKGAHHAAKIYQPQMCIIGEPSGWDRLTLGYKGRLIVNWRWEGGLSHSAGQAITGAEQAFAYWSLVRAYVDGVNTDPADGERTRIFDRLDATLQSINSGDDGVNGWAEMTIGFRIPPNIDPYAVAEAVYMPEVKLVHGVVYPFTAERDSILSRVMRGAIREHGGQPAFVNKTGTSDMNLVGQLWKCPILAYGPGDSALDHTPDEHLDLDEYHRAIRVLATALGRL
jgi:LysW-gamma-L-lysine carboxypeptidase